MSKNIRFRASKQISTDLEPFKNRGGSGSIVSRLVGGSNKITVEYVVWAGGAGGGSHWNGSAWGYGGSGGARSSVVGETSGRGSAAEPAVFVKKGKTATIGVGGGGGVNDLGASGGSGGSSSFVCADSGFSAISITSNGGGGGGSYWTGGNSGGCGGGGSRGGGPGSGTAGQGYDGSGASGGGTGVTSSITGSSQSFSGNGGSSGCGTIGSYNPPIYAGCGGGGGRVTIRYPKSFGAAASYPGATQIIAGNFYVYQWTGSGSITF